MLQLDETKLRKIINKKENDKISYIKVTKKEHPCKDNIINTSIINIKTETEEIKLLEELLSKNLEKSLLRNVNYLTSNNIHIKKAHVKNILQKLRQFN